jgi:uncharacterized protein (DUF433 family)
MGNQLAVITPVHAWEHGTNLKRAVRLHPAEVRAWLYAEVAKLCKDIDANKTLGSDEELQFTCRAIIDDFPAIKMEEVRAAFDMIRMGKFGKLYERLKTAEILDALRRYEGEVRTEILENRQYERSFGEMLSDMNLTHLLDRVDTSPQPKGGEGVGTRLRKTLG